MSATSLPVSGISVQFRPLTGAEETLLWEAGFAGDGLAHADLRLALMLAERVAMTADSAPLAVAALPLTDLDALLLLLRRSLFGDTVRAEARCPSAECTARMDVSFGIADYLASQAPERPRGVERHREDPMWFRFTRGGSERRFRPPTASDVLAVAGERAPEEALFQRCVAPTGPVPARERRRIERALSEVAPMLESGIDGLCPECGAVVKIGFSPRSYVLQELRGHAAFVLEEVHLLAAVYHWTEADILALPRSRRRAYTERIREMLPRSHHTEGSRTE